MTDLQYFSGFKTNHTCISHLKNHPESKNTLWVTWSRRYVKLHVLLDFFLELLDRDQGGERNAVLFTRHNSHRCDSIADLLGLQESTLLDRVVLDYNLTNRIIELLYATQRINIIKRKLSKLFKHYSLNLKKINKEKTIKKSCWFTPLASRDITETSSSEGRSIVAEGSVGARWIGSESNVRHKNER